jgi:uncharacterized HAD superfamily protein
MFLLGTNSWLTIAEADIYFSDIWDGSFWSSLLLSQKQRLLITACKWILSSGYSISMSSTAQKVKDAQCELAKEVYNAYDEYKKRQRLYASGVRNFNFNGWSESLAKQELPVNIQDLLEDFATGQGGKFFELHRDY